MSDTRVTLVSAGSHDVAAGPESQHVGTDGAAPVTQEVSLDPLPKLLRGREATCARSQGDTNLSSFWVLFPTRLVLDAIDFCAKKIVHTIGDLFCFST